MTSRGAYFLVLALALAAVALVLLPASGLAQAAAQTRVGASAVLATARAGDFTPLAAVSQLGKTHAYDENASGSLLAAEGGADITAILSEHVAAGSEKFAADRFTRGQLAALDRNPGLEAAFRGERIDTFAKQSAALDPRLNGIQITGRFQRGADFIDPVSGNWWDITTEGQWDAHVARYGPGGTMLPY